MSLVYIYPPNEQYVTTPLNTTFPEAHWPMQDAFHKVGHAVHNFVHPHDTPDIRTPHADVRETVENYYIDVELPGVGSKDELSLTWTSGRTLLVEATIKRPEIPEDQQQEAEVLETAQGAEADAKSGKQYRDQPVHFLARERRLGLYGRAFHLPFDVDHDKLETSMKSGLLRVVVPKPEIERKEPKKVDVKHEDA
jgi:HSP20 family molecular chaperone IbpA